MKKSMLVSKSASLICLDYPHQLLPALTALDYQGSPGEAVILFIKYQHASKMGPQEERLIQNLVSHFPNIQIFKAKKWICNPQLPVRFRAYFLRSSFTHYRINQIFFAHDVSGDFTAQVLMQAFPRATPICYGDSLGLVYSHAYFESLMYVESASFTALLSKLKRKWILPRASRRLHPAMAILAIPCDPGGDFMRQCELKIPPKESLLKTIVGLKKGLPDFSSYLNAVLQQAKFPLIILATSNLTESKLCERENEIALYLDIIKAEVHSPATILIKPHPGSSQLTLNHLVSALGGQHDVMIFDKHYNSLPIELAEELIGKATILSISYASISIPYLYDSAVKHALNDDLITRYIYPEKQNWLKSNNDLYLKMIIGLKTWSGDTVLTLEDHHGN